MSGPPQLPPPTDTAPDPPKGRRPVLGCLLLVLVLGIALVGWLMGWLERRQTGARAERARIHHLRRVAEDQIRAGVPAEPVGAVGPESVPPETVRALVVLSDRVRDLHAAGDWAGVIQCIGVLQDLAADDPELDAMLESALFNHALQQLHRERAIPALESLQRLLVRTPADREASDLQSIGRTIRDSGLDQRSRDALAQFKERQ